MSKVVSKGQSVQPQIHSLLAKGEKKDETIQRRNAGGSSAGKKVLCVKLSNGLFCAVRMNEVRGFLTSCLVVEER